MDSHVELGNLDEVLDNILSKSTNIENTIKNLHYMLNIKDITKTKYYNDPTGGIITIGNNILNKHNFIINIDKNNKEFYLNIGFVEYNNNIRIPLNNIKSNVGSFPSNITFKLEYEKPYLNVYISYSKKNKDDENKTIIKGYLDSNGNIIDSTGNLREFKKNNSDINFNIIFPAYKNPWCSVGTIDNINVISYHYDSKGFLNSKYSNNKVIKNVSFDNDRLNSNKPLLNTNKTTKILFRQNDTLVFDLKLKKPNISGGETGDTPNWRNNYRKSCRFYKDYVRKKMC